MVMPNSLIMKCLDFAALRFANQVEEEHSNYRHAK